MKCPDENTLKAHVAEALDPRRSDWISKHIEVCPDCRAKNEELSGEEELLRQALAKPIDFDAMAKRVWRKLQSDDKES